MATTDESPAPERGPATMREEGGSTFRAADGATVSEGTIRGEKVVRMVADPLDWYRNRGLINREQFSAGTRLREDHYRAFGSGYSSPQIGPTAGIRAPGGRPSGGRVVWERAAAYKAALAALPSDQSAMAEAVCCHAEYAKPFAKRKGWPPRSGIATLRDALTALSEHYRREADETYHRSKG